MKNCTGCRYAEWLTTKAGRLHPSGNGHCKYPYKVPELPAAFHWLSDSVLPYGGDINRRREFKSHCTYFAREACAVVAENFSTRDGYEIAHNIRALDCA